jgi:hypothetical protein
MSHDSPRWQGTDRRTNLRLRAIIDELQAQARVSRAAIQELSDRIDVLTQEVEGLRKDRTT